MIEVINIENHQHRRAKELYEFKVLKNSFTEGDGNYAGAIGEIVVCDFYRELCREVIHAGTKDYDMIIDGYTVDVKTTSTSVFPQSNYSCKVAETSLHQQTKFYIFARYSKELNQVYICGGISKSKFLRIARSAEQGDKDAYDWEYPAPCLWCRINES